MNWMQSFMKLTLSSALSRKTLSTVVKNFKHDLHIQHKFLPPQMARTLMCRCGLHKSHPLTSFSVKSTKQLLIGQHSSHSFLRMNNSNNLNQWNFSKRWMHLSSTMFSVKSSLGGSKKSESSILKDVSALKVKRMAKKKKFNEDGKRVDVNSVVAYAVAEELSLATLSRDLHSQGIYEPKQMPGDVTDAIHVQGTDLDLGQKDIFVFEDGSVVFWCVPELERGCFLKMLTSYTDGPYLNALVLYEHEELDLDCTAQATGLSGDMIQLSEGPSSAVARQLELYSFSNAMAHSVKLAIWEASLAQFVESIEGVTEDLRHGNKIKMTRKEVLMKTGELFSLRHLINLSSDLLDTPDFYWDRSSLEPLYTGLCTQLHIRRRTRVINEKLNHCVELTELLTSQLNDAHHIRLEWMIIVLIMVEVVFEIVHYSERFLEKKAVAVASTSVD